MYTATDNIDFCLSWRYLSGWQYRWWGVIENTQLRCCLCRFHKRPEAWGDIRSQWRQIERIGCTVERSYDMNGEAERDSVEPTCSTAAGRISFWPTTWKVSLVLNWILPVLPRYQARHKCLGGEQ